MKEKGIFGCLLAIADFSVGTGIQTELLSCCAFERKSL
jgi:hypothetical protein